MTTAAGAARASLRATSGLRFAKHRQPIAFSAAVPTRKIVAPPAPRAVPLGYHRVVPFLGLLLAAPVVLPAQARTSVVVAQVVSRDGGAPIERARATFDGTAQQRTTDADGRLVVRLPAGQPAVVQLRRLGFEPTSFAFRVAESDTTRVTLAMRPVPRALDAVVVAGARAPGSALLADLERRRRTGRGTILSQRDLADWNAQRPSDALRRVMGVRIMDSAGVRIAVSTRGPKLVQMGGSLVAVPCVMRVGLNGVVKEPGFDVDLLSIHEVYAVEVYQGPASIPSEFASTGRDTFCGLVMLWTRVE